MQIQIIECKVSCNTCGTPITSFHPMEKGLRINRVASLGSELVTLRERRKSTGSKSREALLGASFQKIQVKALTSRIADVMSEIVALGGEFDTQGFIHLAS